MRHALLPSLLLAASLCLAQQAPPVVLTQPLDPDDEAKQFVLPKGFVAQLVAADPQIRKPMNIAFDDAGRLWVTDTVEYPFPAADPAKARDSVKILEDFAPDGRARKVTTFADKLNIPIGLLPLTGSRDALVYSIPAVLRLGDSKGVGVADSRRPALTGYGFDDTHGMTSGFTHGFDGYVYACHGFRNSSAVKGGEGKALALQSGNTYRFKPDASRAEQYTHGQVNPFGLCLDRWGYVYSADCHSQPIYQLIRGGHYPSFGKPHDGLGFAPETITNYRGSTAVCGVACPGGAQWPDEFQNDFLVGDVMTNEIVRFVMDWTGTSPRAKQQVFLASKDRWFRPVDIKLGPDGALYVADFYNCIIGHYEVDLKHPRRDRTRGRIWRIVYTGKDLPAPDAKTDFTKMSVGELVEALGDRNLTRRLTAQRQLVHRGKAVVPAVKAAMKDSPERIAHGLWVLEHLGALDADGLKTWGDAKVPLAATHAMRVLSEREALTDAERQMAVAALKGKSPHVARAAADALGRHPHKGDVLPLVALFVTASRAGDTHLAHTCNIALRNQLPVSWQDAASWPEREKRVIARAALGVPSKESAAFLVPQLTSLDSALGQQPEFYKHVARHGEPGDVKALVTWAKSAHERTPAKAGELLKAIEQGAQQGKKPLPPEARAWAIELTGALLDARAESARRLGAELTATLRLREQEAKVLALAVSKQQPEAVRGECMNALLSLDAATHARTLGGVLTDAQSQPAVREQAAAALGKANQDATRQQLVAALPLVPARLQGRVANALSQSQQGCDALVKAVEAGKASAQLLTDVEVRVRVDRAGYKREASRLTRDLPPADVKVAALIEARRKAFDGAKADAEKGAKLFEKHCAVCHQVSGKGAKVGPQLDGIGLRGIDRLLEDVLDPNRNVDAAFRQTTLTTKKGQVLTGLVLREEGAVVVIADQAGKEARVAADQIDKREVAPLSPMPANAGEAMTAEEFVDLVGYLLTVRPK